MRRGFVPKGIRKRRGRRSRRPSPGRGGYRL